MIIKASQRGGGANLAVHLQRTDDNEHVLIHELRGFVSDDLHGAFKEVDAVRRGTKCQQYLFSVSFSPPETASLTEDQFVSAIERVEQTMGLEEQPRAVVFHEKHGRRHAHAVWSRIDAQTMTARPLSFFKSKLRDVSRELFLEHGWKMPSGLVNTAERDPTNFTLAEYQKAKRQSVDPRWIKQAVQDAWATSDSRKAFENALQGRGIYLAKGDRRGFVIVDHDGDVHALARTLDLKAKAIGARLGDPSDLRDVAATQKDIAARMTPAIRKHIAASRTKFQEKSATLAHAKMEMTHRHRDARTKLETRHKQKWIEETKQRQARIPRGLRGLWSFFSGRTAEIKRQNEAEARASQLRQAQERQSLIDRQLTERRSLQEKFKELRSRQAAQLLDLRRDIGRYLQLARSAEHSRHQDRSRSRERRIEP